jgi:DNA-binding XRE family transcriptional regulator
MASYRLLITALIVIVFVETSVFLFALYFEWAEPQMITGAQVKAARALLGWSQMKLTIEAELALQTLIGLETGRRLTRASTIAKFQKTLERAGVEFPKNEPPRLRGANAKGGKTGKWKPPSQPQIWALTPECAGPIQS